MTDDDQNPEQTAPATKPTARAVYKRLIATNPRFRLAPKSERGFGIAKADSMIKTTIIAALAFAVLASEASALSKALRDSSGRTIGRTTTSGNTTSTYDASGKLISRATRTGNQTTIYDASGKVIGRETTNR
ncbi:MAG: hypothetical protein ABWY66_13985 [Xanthobacteraceae bacterium]